MPGVDFPHVWAALWTFSATPGAPFGYIGPGAGLEFLGYALALFLYVLTALSAVLLWPVYVLLRRVRGRKDKGAPPPPAADVPGASGEEPTRP